MTYSLFRNTERKSARDVLPQTADAASFFFFFQPFCQTDSQPDWPEATGKIYILLQCCSITRQEMYSSGNAFPAAQSSADLCSANALFCRRLLAGAFQLKAAALFAPPPPLRPSPTPPTPSSTAAKWTRIDSWPSPAATRRKSSTSTRRKAASPRTRTLTWWCGTPR